MERPRSGLTGSVGPVNGWGGQRAASSNPHRHSAPEPRTFHNPPTHLSYQSRKDREGRRHPQSRHSMPVQQGPAPASPHSPTRASPASDREQAGDRFGPRVSGPADMEALRRDCNQRRQLYEDSDFPAADTALYYSRQPPYKFVWRRPPEIAAQYGLAAEMFVETPGHFSVRQGELGDCWVVSALAILSDQTSLLYRVVPPTQSFTTPWYVGAFEFYFWRHGKWEQVIVDDRLPTVNGQLAFVHSSAPNEFWSALLEKAYAKLHGSYEALKSGVASDALHDLSGGVVEIFPFRADLPLPDHFINTIFQALQRHSLVSGETHQTTDQDLDILANGLMSNHTYSISDLREIRLISEHGEIPVTLIRLRSAWGRTINWAGPWSERSVEWQSIPNYDRQSMGLIVRDKAEFWMDLQDFLKTFSSMTICSLPPDNQPELPPAWFINMFHGRWRKGVTAGGRPVSRETHWTNPQYCLRLQTPDSENPKLCTVIVELEQKDRRRIRQRAPSHVDIGFVIYKCYKEYTLPLGRHYFDQHTFIDRCNYYSNTRQIAKRFILEPGEYIVMPTTYDPNTESDFLLRVFFEKENKIEYVDHHADIMERSPTPSDPELQERQDTFRDYFYSVAGENMEIDAFEFRQVLNMGLQSDPHHHDVSIDACKTMLTLVDFENTGMLGYHQFLYLWNCICSWKRTFYEYDRRNTGEIDAFVLRSVLGSLGYRLNSSVITKLVFRFANERYQIPLDDFLLCMAKLLTLLHVFKSHQKNGTAAFTLDEWLEETLVI